MRRTLRKRSKRTTRKQSGGGINLKKLLFVLANRKRASALAALSAKKAKELKERFE